MINLIPKREIENIHQAERRRMLVVLGVLFIFSLFAFFMGLLSVDISIKGEVKAGKIIIQEEKAIREKSGLSDLLKRIDTDNKRIVKLNSFFNENLYPSDILKKLIKNIPSGVYLKEVSFREEKGTKTKSKNKRMVLVSGFSKDRLALFEFKKNLEKETDFSNLIFPPSNWINSQNIDFQFSFEIKQ